jgi:hypothetical protein
MDTWNDVKQNLSSIDTKATQVDIHLQGTEHEETARELLDKTTQLMNQIYEEEGSIRDEGNETGGT